MASLEAELISLVSSQRVINSLAVSSLALLAYDHLLTLKHEVRYIWKKKMSILDVMIIFIRYFTLIFTSINVYYYGHVFNQKELHRCLSFLLLQSACSPIIASATDCILAIRIWALYKRNKCLLYFLIFLISAQTIVILTISIDFYLVHPGIINLSILNLPGCYPSIVGEAPVSLKLVYVPNMVTAIVMFLLSISRCVRYVFADKGRSMPFMTLFLRDGVMWFMAILAVLLVELVLTVTDSVLGTAMVLPIVVTSCISSSRVLINMRSIGSSPGDKSEGPRLTTLRFHAPGQGGEFTGTNISLEHRRNSVPSPSA